MNGWLLALLITAGILGILVMLRFGLRVVYMGGEVEVYFCISRIRFRIYASAEKKAKKQKKAKKKKRGGKPSGGKPQEKKKNKRSLGDILELVGSVSGVAARLLKRIRVEVLRGRIIVCGKDAAAAAIAYGNMWAAVGAAHALLDNLVTVKSFAVDVLLDYEGDKTRAEGVLEIAFRNLYVEAAIYGIVRALWGHKNVLQGSGGSPRKLTKRAAADAVSGKDQAAQS